MSSFFPKSLSAILIAIVTSALCPIVARQKDATAKVYNSYQNEKDRHLRMSVPHLVLQSNDLEEEEELAFHQTCIQSLRQADVNHDLKITPDHEFVYFLQLVGVKAVSIKSDTKSWPFFPFDELPLVLVAMFHSGACVQCFRMTGKENCCLGGNAHIDTTRISSERNDSRQVQGGEVIGLAEDITTSLTTQTSIKDNTFDFICDFLQRYILHQNTEKAATSD